jgi:hypothetical protein
MNVPTKFQRKMLKHIHILACSLTSPNIAKQMFPLLRKVVFQSAKYYWKTLEGQRLWLTIVISSIIAHFPAYIKVRGRVKKYTWPWLVSAVHEDIGKHQPTQMGATTFQWQQTKVKILISSGHARPRWGTHSLPVDVNPRAYLCPMWKILPRRNSSTNRREMNDRTPAVRGHGLLKPNVTEKCNHILNADSRSFLD